MADKLVYMIINKITPLDYNYWLKRFDFQLNEPTIQISPKLFSQQIRKFYHKSLGTNVINSPVPHASCISTKYYTYLLSYSWECIIL